MRNSDLGLIGKFVAWEERIGEIVAIGYTRTGTYWVVQIDGITDLKDLDPNHEQFEVFANRDWATWRLRQTQHL